MGVVLINPNSTEAMTETMLAVARAAAPGMAFEGWTSRDGPAAIQGEADGEAASGPLLDLVRKADRQGADGIVIGCFDDTALAASSRLARCPVIGIGQAAFHACALRGWRFSVVTTLPVSVPVIEGNIARYGLSGMLGQVRASGVPVLDLEAEPDGAVGPILREAEAALRDDGVDGVVLGCAGMATVSAALRAALDAPVIDTVEAAAGAIAWLSAMPVGGLSALP
ncbi:MAG: aspartate/glutamate racemase family protein [Pseudomonadota bacterium]